MKWDKDSSELGEYEYDIAQQQLIIKSLPCKPYNVVGFRGLLQNHMILGISCSCTGSIGVFS